MQGNILDYNRREQLKSLITPVLKLAEKDIRQNLGQFYTVTFNEYESTSYCDQMRNQIVIGSETLNYGNPELFIAFLYTIVQHETGHAIYTGTRLLNETQKQNLQDFQILNVMEDARMERLVSAWNNKVRFRAVRRVLHDRTLLQILKQEPERLFEPHTLCMALYRTVDNKPFRKFFVNKFGEQAIAELDRLASEYIYDNSQCGIVVFNRNNTTFVRDLSAKYINFETYLLNMLSNQQQNQNQNQQQSQSNSQQNGGNGQSESESNSNEQSDSNGNESEQNQQQNGGGSKSDKNKQNESEQSDAQSDGESGGSGCSAGGDSEKPEDLSDLDDFINSAIKKAQQQLSELSDGIVPKPSSNPSGSKHRVRNHISINMAKTGYQGKKAKSLSQNRHSFIGTVSSFDRSKYRASLLDPASSDGKFYKRAKTNNSGCNTTSVPRISFYMDFSGSMNSYGKDTSVLDYVTQFYDKMHRFIDIDFYAFSSETVKLSPEYLDFGSLLNITGMYGGTYIRVAKDYKKSNLNIVLTDGSIANIYYVEKDFKENSVFIIVMDSADERDYYEKLYSDCKHKILCTPDGIINAYTQATKKIESLLR